MRLWKSIIFAFVVIQITLVGGQFYFGGNERTDGMEQRFP